MKKMLVPTMSVGKIVFGMDRREVRHLQDGFKGEFKKNKFSKNTTDDFENCHVYYDTDNRCNAVEFLTKTDIEYEGLNLFEMTISDLKKLFPDLVEEYGYYISKKYSVGITYGEGKVEGILIGCKGYYV